MIEPATNWMRTWAPSGVNCGLTAGAGKSLTLHVNADCGANVPAHRGQPSARPGVQHSLAVGADEVARVDQRRVGPRAAAQPVLPGAAVEAIVARTAVETVVARAAVEAVRAAPARDSVGAVPTVDDVALARPRDRARRRRRGELERRLGA